MYFRVQALEVDSASKLSQIKNVARNSLSLLMTCIKCFRLHAICLNASATKYAPFKTEHYLKDILIYNCLKDSFLLHLARKYAWIFVLGHYLFTKAHRVPRATLSEICSLLAKDNVRGQIRAYFHAKLRLLFI